MTNYIIQTVCCFMIFVSCCFGKGKFVEEKTECPKIKPVRNFDLNEMLGTWYIIQYYASSEEALPYRCMRAEFSISSLPLHVTMNFTYSFVDDPINEHLFGNITWTVPDTMQPAHWTHSEDTYEGIYNTYVLDSDYSTWALLMHCAEKSKSPRYLSSFIMSREPLLGINVISYLREKLPKYDIDLDYMFDMSQKDCDVSLMDLDVPPSLLANRILPSTRRHPLKSHHSI
ncbi:lopap [Agrilus planipennis]|uniref:Lopap n=1 Tax=Agrilus planipennis TaxID=224129 RepID=A0A1W4WMU8_AGRPL|nr:lopap [Agrilus planipennis]